jgi:KDO2-lipid IV(A) lauroyltransferase
MNDPNRQRASQGGENEANSKSPLTPRGILLSLLVRLFGWMPFKLNQAVGTAIGDLLWWLPNRSREVAKRNIELCYPDLDAARRKARVRNNMQAIGQSFTELCYFWSQPVSKVMRLVREIHGLEHFDRAMEDGRGLWRAAPHLGSWELMGQYIACRTSCVILYKVPKDPGVDRVIVRGRERHGTKLIRADSRGVREVFRAAADKKLIGILPDQQPKKGQGEFAPFFGIQALTMVLLPKLAQRTEIPVLFGYAERLPGARGYDLHFVPADPEIASADLATSVAALNRGVERCVRACPDQYAWGYKRFSIRPQGEEPLY